MTAEAADKPGAVVPSRDAIREQWEWAAAGWRRWEPYFASASWPVTLQIILDLQLLPGMRVLDVGCGIGDPSLQAAFAVGPKGHVLALDLAGDMIDVAQARARAMGITNIEYRVGAVEDLRGLAGAFDAVIARFTIMFFTDLPAGMSKLHDLLRAGGRVAVSTWAPTDRNRMFGIPGEQIARVAELPKPPRDAPGPLRLSRSGELEAALEHAGFAEVRATEVRFYNFGKDAEEYFTVVYDMAPMFRKTFDSLTADQQRRVRKGIMEAVSVHADGGVIRVPAVAHVGTGLRASPAGI